MAASQISRPTPWTLALVTVAFAASSAAAEDCIEAPIGIVFPASFQALDVPSGAVRRAQTTMGTTLSLGASGVECKVATAAFGEVYAEFDRLERLISTSDPKSDLSRVNAAAGLEPIVVDTEVYTLVELSLLYARVSGGAFDPTFAAMDGVWRFTDATVPTKDAVEEARLLIGYSDVVIDPKKKTIFLKRAGMRLSLGGIAKGYATDNAVSILKRRGISNFIIRSGAEVFISGTPGGGKRPVGIPRPRADGTLALIDVSDSALNISRDIERSFVADGVRYHHILDPRTGYPAHHVRTVTVVADRASAADAFSTALFVLGPKKGLELVESHPGVEALIVDSEHRVHLSSGMADRVQLRSPGPVDGP